MAVAIVLGTTGVAYADGLAHTIGRVFGDFGGGVGEAAIQSVRDNQARWVTIEPRTKADCLSESHGVINSTYVRCRHGRQELTRFDSDGGRVVLSERAIPEW
ncbi:hypothetical protein [Salinisphaera sp. T31B1]|uniref:hypothetical protein n=1 Tax=Salinisphaera sp. T31B1 TaxID=727963 RepID=UPI00333F7697